jgi:hypothetical protein
VPTSRASTRRAAPAAFLLFAAVLFVVGPAEASRTKDGRSDLAPTSAEALLPPSLELASLELSMHGPVEPSRFGFGEDLGLLDVEERPCGFELFGGVGTRRCALTYARNNPLKYVDPDGREEMEAVLMANQRMQLRETGGEAAVQRFDRTNAVMAGAFVATVAGGAAIAQWGPAAMMLGRELFARFGDKVEEAAIPVQRSASSLLKFDPGTVLNDANKASHFFKEGHQLEQLGTRTEALTKIADAVQKAYSSGALKLAEDGRYQQVLKVEGKNVLVQGKVIRDVLRIGDAWIPR